MTEERQECHDAKGEDRFTILEVFGLKLAVSNPRLADLLTMDAEEVLSANITDLKDPKAIREARAEAQEGVPDVVIAPTTPHDEQDAKRRKEMREKTSLLGERMGFTSRGDGVWESPTGILLVTRTVERSLSYAGASHFVVEIAEHRAKIAGDESTVLFITADQQTADVMKVAIRQARLYHLMRTVSVPNLEVIERMFGVGTIDHNQAVILLAPVADIDVGEMLSVIRAASGGSGESD